MRWKSSERIGVLIMPKRPCEWRVDSHGCYKFDNAFGPRDQSAQFPVFLHFGTTNLPGPDSIMRSEHAQQRRLERRHHKHDRTRRRRTWSPPCPSSHVSAFLFTLSAVARESLASQLCLPTALTHGRFASSLCLCLFLFLFVSRGWQGQGKVRDGTRSHV